MGAVSTVFSFLNTFFVLSLLLSVVVVVLMLYQFRQRINQLEEKTQTMLEIVNSIVEKLNIREIEISGGAGGHVPVEMPEDTPEMERLMNQDISIEEYVESDNNSYDNEGESEEESDGEEESDDEEESDGEDEEESDDDEEEEEQQQQQQEEVQETQEEQPEIQEDVSEPTGTTMYIDIPDEVDIPTDTNTTDDMDNTSVMTTGTTDELSKLTVSQLKDAVREKGIQSSNISKMRKGELIELLEGEN
jgi:outer membrane biosynthesis protein TonB